MIKVNSIQELRDLVASGHNDYVLRVGGFCRSSKYINEGEHKAWCVLHLIDDSEEEMTDEELMASNIGRGMQNGCFYCEE